MAVAGEGRAFGTCRLRVARMEGKGALSSVHDTRPPPSPRIPLFLWGASGEGVVTLTPQLLHRGRHISGTVGQTGLLNMCLTGFECSIA